MTKLTLMIEGDASTLAKLLASLGASASAVTVAGHVPSPQLPNAPDDDEANDAPAAAGTLDADGLPHDTRIHSDPAKLTSKGVWRKRRGVDDATVAAVEAELRARTVPAVPVTVPQPVQPPAPQMPVVTTPPPGMAPVAVTPQPMEQFTVPASITGGAPVQLEHPAPMPAQAVPQPQFTAPAPQPAAPQMPSDFNQFMTRIQQLTGMKQADGVTPLVDGPYLANLSARVGQQFGVQMNSIMDLAANPQYLAAAVNMMASEGRW